MDGAARRRAVDRLRSAFAWLGDKTDKSQYADVTGWWRSPEILRDIGPLLAGLAPEPPTVVLGLESRGFIVGGAVALHLRVGFVEVRKNPERGAASDAWILQTTPPDYRDRHLRLGIKRSLLKSGDRVLLVDDWIDTGSQALATQQIVQQTGATWVGTATIVDALESNNIRRQLNLRSLTHIRDL
ncbi:MAG TPA: phosphoribosyltransferase family protein [Actinophytocola sp.]|uniref:phosphoribosyltransferase family protein n=1 Tax=Actinophytocola sp. TaxID=1872138 RepID=UPI002DC03685|nr:phosphoribosyltransferase family protein [Actinophytocola sp.]HEU5471222.1 phosphoribosyltransferase family protein [Actinophytocola sp.]